MSSCFITGGLGFIGYHLCLQLIRQGFHLTVYDAGVSYLGPHNNLHSAQLDYRRRELLDHIELITGDIRDPATLSRSIDRAQPEVIFHLAAIPLPSACASNPSQALDVNVVGLGNLLTTLRSLSSLRRLVFVSSSYVLGHFQHEPASEEHPTNPVDIYGATKLAGEVLVTGFAKNLGIEYVIVRPSAVYGPTDCNRRVVQIFVERALAGMPLVVRNGSSRLDFTYCEDLAQGLMLTATSPNAANQVFHLTRGHGRSLQELADIVRQVVPGASVTQETRLSDEPKRGTLDISKAATLLGYLPQVSLEDGVARYATYVRRQIEAGITPPPVVKA